MSAAKTLFQRICEREIPADIVYEDEHCIAFRDINPQAPLHLLVVPRRPIPSLAEVQTGDEALLGHLLVVVARLAEQLDMQGGFRTVINTRRDGGQTVDHLHIHVLAGRTLRWPPG
jgi:histidine triad (HIT) family protein